MYETRNSIYCYKGTDILINKLNIKDKDILKEYERKVVSLKLLELERKKISGNFDINHFCSIHAFLFEDIYSFAGLYRTEDIAKDNFKFARWEYIENELQNLLGKLREEEYLTNLDKKTLANRLAFYISELNVLHPFREGNGRTIREFIRQLALKNNYYLNFSLINPKEILNASIKSVIDINDLSILLYTCLENV